MNNTIPEFKIVALRQAPLPSEMVQINNMQDAYNYWRDIIKTGPNYRTDVEQSYVLLLTETGRVLGHSLIGLGSSNMVLSGPKQILRVAVLANASSIIVFHNHPNNETQPSEEDKKNTSALGFAAGIFDIQLVDHLVVGEVDAVTNPKGFSSIREAVEKDMRNQVGNEFQNMLDDLKSALEKAAEKRYSKETKEPVPA